MKRYDKEHDEKWFLGVSAYQWSFGVLPMSILGLAAGLAGNEPSLVPGLFAFAISFAIAWSAWLVSVLFLCFSLVPVARADRDPDFESGLVSIPIEGNQVMPGPTYARPQLIHKDTSTRPTVGTVAALAGGLTLAGGWVMYVVRQDTRLQVRSELGGAVDTWETQGAWAMSLTGFGSANLVASEYLLLPESKNVPFLAWLGGLGGAVTAAVGVGYIAGGTHCGPLALKPGAEIPLGCMSGTSDALFGWQLLMSSAPLLNLPLTYLLRKAFAGPAESLTLGPGGVKLVGRF